MNELTVTMKHLPPQMQPYEKCISYGPEFLTDAELIACILRSGTKEYTSVALAEYLLNLRKDKRGLEGLCNLSFEELIRVPGIGRVKALQIQCIFELAKRMTKSEARKTLCFADPQTIADYYMEDLRHKEQEHLLLLLLDVKSKLLGEKMLFTGSINASIISPREIYLEALKYHAAGIILLHNHPSGDPTPSMADRRATKKIQEAGSLLDIPLLDHIVIGDKQYVSFHEKGYL
ncbi:MAG: DNA repair protein RadC [Lachnospiraceae bacterium]|nr:DNA repair protein RadC [Lachnospiraceae bacterium]